MQLVPDHICASATATSSDYFELSDIYLFSWYCMNMVTMLMRDYVTGLKSIIWQ